MFQYWYGWRVVSGIANVAAMAAKGLNIQSLLDAAFVKSELDFLHAQPEFTDALQTTKTADGFERLCELAEQLLKSASQGNVCIPFRTGNRKRRPQT